MRDLFIKVISVSILLGVIVYSFFFINKDLIARFDFTSFITAANIIKSGEGKSLYQINVQKDFQKELTQKDSLILYRNPPTLALIFVPLSYFPLTSAYKLFIILGIFLLLFSVKLLFRLYPKIDKKLIFLYTVSFIPGLITIITGQTSFLFFIIFTYIVFSLHRKNNFLTGIFTGFLYSKPQFLIFVPFLILLVKDKKKFVEGLTLSLGLHFLITILVVGVSGVASYSSFIAGTENIKYSSDPLSQISFTSFLTNLSLYLPYLKGKETIINIFLFLVVFIYFVLINRVKNKDYFFNSALLFTLAFLPHLWDYDLVLVLLPVFFLLDHKKREGGLPIFLYWGWLVRFIGYPFLTSLILLFTAGSILSISLLRIKKDGLI